MSLTTLMNKSGAITRDGSAVATAACAVIQPKGQVSRNDVGVTIKRTVLVMPIGTNVAARDIVTIGGVLYRVDSVSDPAGRGHHLECDAMAVE